VLGDFRGVLQTDGFSGYQSLVRESQGRLTAAACWMHARRGFDEARYTTSQAIVEETLARIGLLYDVEARAKAWSFEDRRALRTAESRGLVDRLFARGPAVGRRNWLFFGSFSGGRTAATLYSVVQSARLYHLDVMAYLTDVLRRLPALLPTDVVAIGELLPDCWTQAHPEHVLVARLEESRGAAPFRPPVAHSSMMGGSPTVTI
jgi:transposase